MVPKSTKTDILITIMNKEELEKKAGEVKIELCKWMANNGVLPSTVEKRIGEFIESKEAAGEGSPLGFLSRLNPLGLIGSAAGTASDFVGSASDLATKALLFGAGTGGVLGIGSAILRKDIEDSIDNSENSEMRKKRMKLEAYKKMIRELKTDAAAI